MQKDRSQVVENLDNKRISYKGDQCQIKPVLRADEAHRLDVWRDMTIPTVAFEVS
jgi:hypothetical protein